MHSKIKKYGLPVTGFLALGASAFAAAPTDLDGVAALGAGYITTGTTVAVSAAILGFGWVGYKIVKKYTKGSMST
ncbi:MAG TPA: hypothetical protein VG838_13765 [Opitutaceae bacterium]|nr:hypothetical protein [Opitutaceae bacterium]